MISRTLERLNETAVGPSRNPIWNPRAYALDLFAYSLPSCSLSPPGF